MVDNICNIYVDNSERTIIIYLVLNNPIESIESTVIVGDGKKLNENKDAKKQDRWLNNE